MSYGHISHLKPRTLLLLAGASLALAACTQKAVQTPQVATPVPVVVAPVKPVFVATPNLTAKERLKKALTLLGNGEEGQARAELAQYMLENPGSETGQVLLEQIDKDPRELYGYQSFSYTLRSGETLSVIADRYLNDRYKFWGLAKYNNISNPAGVSVGQSILIPGKQRVVAKAASNKNDDDEIEDRIAKERKKPTASNTPKPTPTPPPAAAPPAPAPIAANPEYAKRLRKQGLEQLQRGSVDKAIAALNSALSYAKGTSLYAQISSDLQRANKIKANMKK
jgi:hypothetical protein